MTIGAGNMVQRGSALRQPSNSVTSTDRSATRHMARGYRLGVRESKRLSSLDDMRHSGAGSRT
jgi:hypothetical protein